MTNLSTRAAATTTPPRFQKYGFIRFKSKTWQSQTTESKQKQNQSEQALNQLNPGIYIT